MRGSRVTPTVGIRIPPCAPLDAVADCARRAETAGYDTVWVPDSQFLFRDPWMALTEIGDATAHIRLAMAVTNIYTRHVSVTAAALQTLEEMAPGRTALGVGTGDSSIKTLGLAPAPLDDVASGFAAIRSLSRGETVEFAGHRARIRNATGRVPPLFMAATGPRALRMAGQIADGVLIMAGVTPALVSQAMAHIDAGLCEAGRQRSDLEICLGAVCYVAEADTDVVRVAKPHCVGDAQRGANKALETTGIQLRHPVPQHLSEVAPDITHADDWDTALAVADRYVSDADAVRYAETFTLIGTPETMATRISAAAVAGIDSVYLRHYRSYTLPEDLIDVFARHVLPQLEARSGTNT